MPDPESEGLLSQTDINAALAAAGLAGESVAAAGSSAEGAAPAVDAPARPVEEVEAAMAAALQSEAAAAPLPANASPFEIPELRPAEQSASTAVQGIDLLRDVELNVKIELGRSRMLVDDVLRLGEGAAVELDKLAGDPVDVFVNNRLVAHGEVLVLNDNFCVRINDIVSRDAAMESAE